ncbi:hypothetical protein CEXT_32761 [Caerostris extrusa]|uniref:Uncharacterized protein n=1 Tax=Caerostris extrusa TaxID=172846 RepID=A0AAV4SMC5_CAEEX|nr:hypothetical protein CEXT_32761 [Caerostris extrusa]
MLALLLLNIQVSLPHPERAGVTKYIRIGIGDKNDNPPTSSKPPTKQRSTKMRTYSTQSSPLRLRTRTNRELRFHLHPTPPPFSSSGHVRIHNNFGIEKQVLKVCRPRSGEDVVVFCKKKCLVTFDGKPEESIQESRLFFLEEKENNFASFPEKDKVHLNSSADIGMP